MIEVIKTDYKKVKVAQHQADYKSRSLSELISNFGGSSDIVKADYLENTAWQSDLILAPTPLTRDEINLFQTEVNCPPCPLHDFVMDVASISFLKKK